MVNSRNLSLTSKLMTAVVSVIALSGLLIVGVVYQRARAALQNQFDQGTRYVTTILSDAAAAYVVRKNVLELYGLVRKYALLEGVEYAFIADAKGTVIAHSLGTFPPELEGISAEEPRHAQNRTLSFRGHIVYDTSIPILGGQVGAAHLGMRRDFVEGEIQHAVLPVIGIVSVILIAVMFLSCLFVRVMTRPIQHLSHMADVMSKGDLDTPVDVPLTSHDEIGDLARSLERMRSSLKAAMLRLSNEQAPLRSDEVLPYIKARFQTVNDKGKKLFVPEAVEKITRYSKCIPRFVDVICDNALLIAGAASKKHVSGEMIDEVARDLKLTGQPQVKAEAATDCQLRGDLKAASQLTQARTHAVDDRQRSDFEPMRGDMYTRPGSRSFSARLRIGILGMVALAGAGIVLYAQENGSLAALVVNFKNLAGIGISDSVDLHRQNPEPARPELTTEVFKEPTPYKSRDPQIPTTKNKEIPPTPMKTITKDRPLSAPEDVALTAQQLGLKIYKAIYNRKITGIEVFVEEGTVYLTGRVATENQKLVAVQAARSVPGVREVLDQIIVDSSIPENSGETS